MATLTLEMIRKRAEHNDGVLHSLEELSLNQLGLINLGFVEEKEQEGNSSERHHRRSLLPRACRGLRHLSLAGNSLPRLPCGPRDLGRCKDLRTLNVALNAIEIIKGGERRRKEETEEEDEEDEEEGPLSSCESLERLDLSGNFVSTKTIRETVRSLASAPVLERLALTGCPVSLGWGGYRRFVIASLPRLRELDGVTITAIERIEALEALQELTGGLVEAEKGKGGESGGNEGDCDGCEESDASSSDSSASSSEADLRNLEREADLLEVQMKKQESGGGEEAKMPWSRAARLLLAREAAAAAVTGSTGSKAAPAAAAAAAAASSGSLFFEPSSRVAAEPARTSMPPWSSSSSSSSDEDEDEDEEGERRGGGKGRHFRRRRRRRRRHRQCDDGSWPFALFPSRDGAPFLVLEVALGMRGCGGGGGEAELDVRARHARVFLSGSLLCARLPAEVDPSRATARRSLASGKLVVEMPLADPSEEMDEACIREWAGKRGGGGGGGIGALAARRAVVTASAASAAVVVAGEEENSDDSDGEGSSSSPPSLSKLETEL